MAEMQGRSIHLDPESANFLDRLKESRHLATDEEALHFCFAEAALALSTPEEWAGDDDPDAAEVLAHAMAHPETLRSHEDVFATLWREMQQEQEAERKISFQHAA